MASKWYCLHVHLLVLVFGNKYFIDSANFISQNYEILQTQSLL